MLILLIISIFVTVAITMYTIDCEFNEYHDLSLTGVILIFTAIVNTSFYIIFSYCLYHNLI